MGKFSISGWRLTLTSYKKIKNVYIYKIKQHQQCSKDNAHKILGKN